MESDEIIGYLLGYIKSTLNGAGALKGKNLVVTSIVDITGGKRINVQWTLDNGTVQTDHVDLTNGNGIKSIAKTSTSGLVDTYTITFDDDTTETFTVTNGADGEDGRDGADGQDGNGIDDIEKTSTAGLVDTYTITLDDGTTKTFTVTNGADGEGVPDGGTTGQILRKKSNTDQDTEWADPSEADLPAGGTTGQVLTKKSNDDGDVEWSTPAGAGDMLKSVYDTDDDGKVDAAEDADAVKGHTVASSGDAGNSDIVLGNDSRLTDARTPVSHTHTKSDITDFSHTHTLSEVTDAGTAAAKNSTNSITAGSTDLAEAGAVKDAIDAAVVSAYHPGGAKTCAELTSALLVAANEGKVYNMSDTGITTADFIEGAGKEIGVGADVAVIPVSGGYKFNLLPGIVDTSGLQPKNLASQVESQSTVEGALGALSTNKAAKVSGGTTGNLASLDASGNPADSGKKASDFIEKSQTSGLVKNDGTIDETQYISDISGKADKVASATNNNFAALDANGNLKDSGISKNIIPSTASGSNKLATLADIDTSGIYGAEWDGSSSQAWTRTDKAVGLADPVPALSNGTGSSPFDDIYPWKGMKRVTDPIAGEVVSIPKFWYKITQTGAALKVQISNTPRSGFLVSPAHADRGDGHGERDMVYVGRYHCDSSYKSTTGVTPLVSKTRAEFRTGIAGLGTGYCQSDIATRQTLWMLYIVEFANWDSQKKIGYGCAPTGETSAVRAMGYTDAMQYHTGTDQASRDSYGGTQYRYIEGLWDNCVDWCDGIYFAAEKIYLIKNPANFSDTTGGKYVGDRATASGYIKSMKVSEVPGYEWFMYPDDCTGATEDTYVGDYCGYNASGVVLFVGGSYGQYRYYGLFYLDGSNAASVQNAGIGSRLLILPSA